MTPKILNSRTHDLLGSVLGIGALILLVLSPWLVDTTGPDPFYKGPLLFPLITLGLILTGALPSLVRLFRPGEAQWHLDGLGLPVRAAKVLACLVLFLAGLMVFGLEISTLAFLAAGLKLVGQDSRVKMILVPLLVTVLLAVIFKQFLGVWFPEPLLMSFFTE
ncbi:MAG: tripartite tricarboxylate transporter TctB family protein [Desulfotignum sp.]